jgi:hypothetical protein
LVVALAVVMVDLSAVLMVVVMVGM